MLKSLRILTFLKIISTYQWLYEFDNKLYLYTIINNQLHLKYLLLLIVVLKDIIRLVLDIDTSVDMIDIDNSSNQVFGIRVSLLKLP